ncbi:MAG: prepilin-type N-terminal cleavage/methylation domain-containing protein [Terrimicrobiaceae bacterium]|nr:prepilin-type N-terminal cleavage/methylation domain-containing protein [Terrimicrobiaceae bacterium]
MMQAAVLPTRPVGLRRSAFRICRGFTLLELLVSMSILALLLVILMGMVDGATKLWRQSENRVDSFREARAALNIIASDLQSIYVAANPKNYSAATPKFFALNSPDGAEAAIKESKSDSLFFVAALPSDSQKPGANKSDLCSVGYFLAFAPASLGNVKESMNLYRYLRSSDDTFAALNDTLPLARGVTIGPSGEEVLARNITSLKIQAYVVDPTTHKPAEFKASATQPAPDFVDIELTALNNDSVKRLKSKADWKDTTSITYNQNARTFSTRVNISSTLPQIPSAAPPSP